MKNPYIQLGLIAIALGLYLMRSREGFEGFPEPKCPTGTTILPNRTMCIGTVESEPTCRAGFVIGANNMCYQSGDDTPYDRTECPVNKRMDWTKKKCFDFLPTKCEDDTLEPYILYTPTSGGYICAPKNATTYASNQTGGAPCNTGDKLVFRVAGGEAAGKVCLPASAATAAGTTGAAGTAANNTPQPSCPSGFTIDTAKMKCNSIGVPPSCPAGYPVTPSPTSGKCYRTSVDEGEPAWKTCPSGTALGENTLCFTRQDPTCPTGFKFEQQTIQVSGGNMTGVGICKAVSAATDVPGRDTNSSTNSTYSSAIDAIKEVTNSLKPLRPPTAPSSDLEKERKEITSLAKQNLYFIQIALFLVVLSLLSYIMFPLDAANLIAFALLSVGIATGFFLRR